ncbi:vacuolar protein sorting-associated protein 52 homolog isoform 1-T1 [Syngnathus typhle]
MVPAGSDNNLLRLTPSLGYPTEPFGGAGRAAVSSYPGQSRGRACQRSARNDIKESQNIALLHQQIGAWDAILEWMEAMLSGFQSDLSSISGEIHTLQQQSLSMNVRLKNR